MKLYVRDVDLLNHNDNMDAEALVKVYQDDLDDLGLVCVFDRLLQKGLWKIPISILLPNSRRTKFLGYIPYNIEIRLKMYLVLMVPNCTEERLFQK